MQTQPFLPVTCPLHTWWTKLVEIGPAFSYYPNPAKTWLVTKQGHLAPVTTTFSGSGVNITPNNGRPYLGAAIGTLEYVKEYVSTNVYLMLASSVILPDHNPKLPSWH